MSDGGVERLQIGQVVPSVGVERGESATVSFDLALLLRTRLLLAASSGAGKSETIRKICQLCAPLVQTIVVDPEGEFAGLRAGLPFVLAGLGGEAVATPATAALLATRLLELKASAVLDIYELKPAERHEFVRNFLNAMLDAPKDLWHPVLIIVDEGHIFAPERGETPSVASEAMAGMASRGRKRGFCLAIATQRLTRLANDVAAMCENVLVGRTTQIDQDRAAKLLNITGKTAKDAFAREIGRVKDGQFYAWGRAFGTMEPVLVQVERVPAELSASAATSDGRLEPPPAPQAIRALLPQLADLPKEAAAQAETVETLRARVRELEAQAGANVEDSREYAEMSVQLQNERLHAAALQRLLDEIRDWVEESVQRLQSLKVKSIRQEVAVVTDTDNANPAAETEPAQSKPAEYMPVPEEVRSARPAYRAKEKDTTSEVVSAPEQRILDAIAWLNAIGVQEPENTAIAFVAKYAPGSGNWNNLRGKLRARGLVAYVPGDKMVLTADGRRIAARPAIRPKRLELHDAVRAKLSVPEVKLLNAVLASWPKALAADKLATAAGYAPGSGNFNNLRGRLKTLGLIDYPAPGMARARDFLFPEGKG